MKIINMIKKFFSRSSESKSEDGSPSIVLIEPDFIDYDGMGNQGRFPVSNKKRK